MHPALFDSLLIFLLLLGNGLFAMTEIAIVSSRRALLQARADGGSKGAAKALALSDAPDRFLSTVQVGISLVGIVAGAFGGARIAVYLAAALAPLPVIGGFAHEVAFVIVIGIITYVSLVVGELVPKTLAMRFPEPIACAMAGPMDKLSRLAAPVVYVLSVSTRALLRLFGVHAAGDARMSREEFTVLVREGLVAGNTNRTESRLMEGVFGFEKLEVYDIMIPRQKLLWIPVGAKHEEVWPQIVRATHFFFPVYQGQRDNLVGVVSLKDVYAQLAAGAAVGFQNLMHAPLLVPESQKASVLLESFRRSGNHAAFVVNEFGGVVGMVTLIDLLESIVGDVPSKEERLALPIRQREDGTWSMDGLIEIEKLGEYLQGFVPPEGGGDVFQTVAGWFSHVLSRVPREGDILQTSGWSFEIIDMDGSRVDKVLATAAKEQPASPAAGQEPDGPA